MSVDGLRRPIQNRLKQVEAQHSEPIQHQKQYQGKQYHAYGQNERPTHGWERTFLAQRGNGDCDG